MPWVRLDDQMAFNAKVVAAGNIAVGARDRMLTWASAAKKDGVIPTAMAIVIVQSEPFLASIGFVPPADFADRALAWMVEHGMLDETPSGYRVHDAEEYGNTASVAVGQKRPMSEAEAKQRKLAAAKSVASRAAKRAAESTARSNGANEEPNGPFQRPVQKTNGPFQRPVQKTNGPFQRSERPVETEPTGCKDARASRSHTLSLKGTDPSAEVSPSVAPAPGAPLAVPVEPTDAQTLASASGCHQDALSTPRTHVESSDASGRATEAPMAAGEAPANCTQDSPLGAWRALGELAGDEVDGIDPRRLVAKLDMAVNAACAWYPKASEIPRAWLAQRLAGKLASHVADRPASTPDQRLAVLVKSIEYVIGDVRNKRANPFEVPAEAPQQRPARPPPMSFAERDEQRRLDASLSGLEALANEGTYGRS